MTWTQWSKEHLLAFHRQDISQDLIEYALIAALVGLVVVAAVQPVASVLGSGVNDVGRRFTNHVDHGLHKGWYK